MTELLDDYRWLVSDAAQPWLVRSTGCDVTTSFLKELRRELSAERARLIAEQVSLRARARRKFPAADRLYLLARGLEQATDNLIGRYKSASLPPGGRVVDLGCGVGGDAMALASSRSLLAVDIDPVCCLFADANLRAAGAASFTVRQQDAGHVALADFDFWHADPDRRPAGRRTVRTEQMRPSAAELVSWLAVNPQAAIKWAPASPVPPHLSWQAEREWIGHSRVCQQQLVRTGTLARHPGRRVATVLLNSAGDGPWQTQTFVETDCGPPETATSLCGFLLEPHAAVIAAGLARQWAAQHAYLQCSSNLAYFTSDRPASDPSAASFRVVVQLPLRVRKIRDWLREHHACVVEVKKRGIDMDPQVWLRNLSLEGDWRLTLLVFPWGPRRIAVLTERVTPA